MMIEDLVEQWKVFNADIIFVILLLCLFVIFRKFPERIIFIVGSMIYLFFTMLWHFPPGLLEY